MFDIIKNCVLEGFILFKILWVKEYEFEFFKKIVVFLFLKDYVRFWMIGVIYIEYFDVVGILFLYIICKEWSDDICN